MKLGIVLPSFMYSPERKKLASDAFYSLANSESLQEESTLLLLVKSGTSQQYTVPIECLSRKFRVILKTDEGLSGTEQTLAFGSHWLLENFGVDYITWMGDDALFHPMWLWKLEGLIKRHPQAKSWSVYRSAYEWVHKTLKEQEGDALVRSICGHGMTFTRNEWKDWGIDWKVGSWGCDYGDTLDLVHWFTRPGERWVTGKSYVQHTGKVGTHCTLETPEYARDFETV
jgi:hypothetical protein